MPAGWCGRRRPAAPHGRSADHRYPAALDASRHAVRIDGDETARANAALLRRALVNLLCNAARHTVVGQTIVVRIDRADGAARMAVVNPGAPIPQPVLDRMFDRFWRGDAARAKSTQGHGLGLAIVRAVALMHGGTTFARSSDGITTVGFTLDDADAPGNWAYHCHLLHHMEAGMFRKVVVS